jgi:hypothetical protein
MITTQAAGEYCVPGWKLEGAPPPMIIVTDPSMDSDMTAEEREAALEELSENDEVTVDASWFEGIFDLESDEDVENRFGFLVRASKTGSMTKELFFEFAVHFVRHLPSDQGKNG